MVYKLGMVLFLLLLNTASSELIRSVDVYKEVIREICEHYQCFSITLFYSEPLLNQDIDVMTKLKKLSMYFEHELLIQTTVTDIPNFASQFSSTRFKLMVKPLFILLNDSENMKVQFTETLVPLLSLSKPMWLIFMQHETSIDGFFEDVFIPFNCKFMVSRRSSPDIGDSDEVIVEIYRVYYGRPLKKDFFATWNITTGMHPTSLTFNQRRNDLDGINIRCAMIDFPPVVYAKPSKHEKKVEVQGYSIEIFKELTKSLNFSITYEMVTLIPGSLPNGTWFGSIGNLLRNLSDMAIGDPRVINGQNFSLDYTNQLFSVEIRFFIKKSAIDVLQWDKFIRPFESEVWLLIGSIVLLGSVIMFVIKFIKQKKYTGSAKRNHRLGGLPFTFLSIFGAFCTQAMPVYKPASLKLVSFTIHISAIITLAAYSARLISFLTTHTSVSYITTTQQLLDDPLFKLTTLKSAVHGLTYRNGSDEFTNIIYDRMLESVQFFSADRAEGLRKMCNYKKLAFLVGQIANTYLEKIDCSVTAMDVLGISSTTMLLQHHSPFLDVFNHGLNLIRESGVLRKILRNSTLIEDEDKTILIAVELMDVITLIALLAGSSIISMLLLLGERIFYVKSNQKSEDKQRVIVRVKPLIHRKRLVEARNKGQKSKMKKKKESVARVQVRERKHVTFSNFQNQARFSISKNTEK